MSPLLPPSKQKLITPAPLNAWLQSRRMFRQRLRRGIYLFAAAGIALTFFSRQSNRVPSAPNELLQNPQCLSTYQRLYAGDTLEIKVVFGYKDSRPSRFVGDRYERAAFVQKMLKLGFARDPDDDDHFEKKIEGPPGSDSKKLKTIHLTVTSSSTGPDDETNTKDPFQKWKTREAEQVFTAGLKHAEVVLYNGHSRDGGGPDFSSPRCTRDHHVDYPWYQRALPGVHQMVAALREADKNKEQKLKLLGLLSCVSDKKFASEILKINPKLALLTTSSLLYYSDALDEVSETVSNLVQMKCQKDFHPSGTHLYGLF